MHGIYANRGGYIDGIHGAPYIAYYSSTMDPSWVKNPDSESTSRMAQSISIALRTTRTQSISIDPQMPHVVFKI